VKIHFQYQEALFLLWLFLLLPWMVLARLAGMAFDGGPTLAAYLLAGAIWSYPISVGIVWRYRKNIPAIALLPFLNVAICVLV
jgi:hypothetical protein